MANTNAPAVANRVASPATFSKMKDFRSAPLQDKGTVEFTPTADGDTLLLTALPVDATITNIVIGSDDLASTSVTLNLGFYKTDTAITIIDEDALGTVIDNDGVTAMTDVRFETKGIETISQRVWELAGLSAKPAYGEMYLALTVAAVTGPTAGTVSYYCNYTV